MDATCAIQASIHVFSLVRKYVSRILGTYQNSRGSFFIALLRKLGVFPGNTHAKHTKMTKKCYPQKRVHKK